MNKYIHRAKINNLHEQLTEAKMKMKHGWEIMPSHGGGLEGPSSKRIEIPCTWKLTCNSVNLHAWNFHKLEIMPEILEWIRFCAETLPRQLRPKYLIRWCSPLQLRHRWKEDNEKHRCCRLTPTFASILVEESTKAFSTVSWTSCLPS
jgi:hypothetical protein